MIPGVYDGLTFGKRLHSNQMHLHMERLWNLELELNSDLIENAQSHSPTLAGW